MATTTTRKVTTAQPVARYKLTALMNVRKAPSLSAPILGTAQADTVISVSEIDKDWMKTTWQGKTAYILYEGGKYASRV